MSIHDRALEILRRERRRTVEQIAISDDNKKDAMVRLDFVNDTLRHERDTLVAIDDAIEALTRASIEVGDLVSHG